MANEELLDDFDEELDEYSVEYTTACKELQERCNAASNISLEEGEVEGDTYFVIGIPCGREKRWLYAHNLEDIKRLLAVPFEQYVFLGNYIAICSYKEGIIEAEINNLLGFQLAYRGLLELIFPRGESREYFTIELTNQRKSSKERIKIGPMSDVLYALREKDKPSSFISYAPTLSIEGIQVSRHDQALDLLEQIAHAVFFQIDLSMNLPLGIRRIEKQRCRRLRKIPIRRLDLQFPLNEYDKEPMTLYWYARNVSEMPLLQFLAYYQVIEFYFPVYSQNKARREIRRILKNPTFRPDRDTDVSQILAVAKTSINLDERSQLRATLQECFDSDQLRAFLTANEERKEFFSRRKSLTENVMPLKDINADIRNSVAERIYDIRCKIVHTKSTERSGESKLLLPFSKEAELLNFDIELVQHVARQVLIAASIPLDLS
jgi:hypothetical protein